MRATSNCSYSLWCRSPDRQELAHRLGGLLASGEWPTRPLRRLAALQWCRCLNVSGEGSAPVSWCADVQLRIERTAGMKFYSNGDDVTDATKRMDVAYITELDRLIAERC
jgi:hypothetical protein